MLRCQSSIPTIEHLSCRFLINTTNCFIDRTVPYLIVRLKVLWLTLLTIISCFAFVIIFQWPKLQFDVCRLTIDTLPFHFSSNLPEKSLKNLDIDITYYMGTNWVPPNEPLIPINDFPTIYYNTETSLTSKPDQTDTFAYVLQTNLSQLTQFCLSLKHKIYKKHSIFK